jgi:hypothetical protein
MKRTPRWHKVKKPRALKQLSEPLRSAAIRAFSELRKGGGKRKQAVSMALRQARLAFLRMINTPEVKREPRSQRRP